MTDRRKKPPTTILDVPKTMMELANRRGSDHLVKYRSLEENMGAAAYRGIYDRNAGKNLLTLFVVIALAAILLMLATNG